MVKYDSRGGFAVLVCLKANQKAGEVTVPDVG